MEKQTNIIKAFKGYDKMDKWRGFTFESCSVKTPEFLQFARDFRAFVKAQLTETSKIVSYNAGHFYVSGFIYNGYSGKYVYFSISDVRHFPGEWARNILIRTAKSDKDYTGGRNDSATLEMFGEVVFNLLKLGGDND